MSNLKKMSKKQVLPVLPLRGITVFPFMILHFDVGRMKSIKALEEAMMNNQLIYLVTQKDPQLDSPVESELYTTGTISKVKQLLKLPGDAIRVLVEGISRADIVSFTQTEPFFVAEVEVNHLQFEDNDPKVEALKRHLITSFEDYVKLNTKISTETIASALSIEDATQISDFIAANLFLKIEEKQALLAASSLIERMEKLIELMLREIEILAIEKDISLKVRKQVEKTQKEYYLREQLKAIQNELGEKDGILGEITEYRQKAEALQLSEEVYQKVMKEIDKLAKIPSGSAEGSVVRNYLEWIFDLPWNIKTQEHIDLINAKSILDEDHYGLDKVKDRILEFLAVRKLKKQTKGPILCLVGPPGVGKTSIARSIARSLNRKYVRIALGGVKDESEIRGHRRTYVGSMPGRIIYALKQAGSCNPLVLLDEIDKMSSDFRGDPSSAMLEVLDGEQNFSFRDHFIELPFDLSDVLFLTTANNLDTIPRALMDRLEIIELSSYTEDEKLRIATKYLIPKQMEEHGVKKSTFKVSESAILDLIRYYTRESGVRNLERIIGKLCRKAIRIFMEEKQKSVRISSNTLEKFLGSPRFKRDHKQKQGQVGVVTGLAWTPVGGEILNIEVIVVPGTGKIELTGQLGDVMKESAKASISFIRTRASLLGIAPDFYAKTDIHIHVPDGATPKDGPSAGIGIFTALLSALTGIPVNQSLGMTGEITLTGRVLPIGGLKEKLFAAHRYGLKTVILPRANEKDLEDIPTNIQAQLQFVFAEDADTVIETAFSSLAQKNLKPSANESTDLLNPALPVHDKSVDTQIKQ